MVYQNNLIVWDILVLSNFFYFKNCHDDYLGAYISAYLSNYFLRLKTEKLNC